MIVPIRYALRGRIKYLERIKGLDRAKVIKDGDLGHSTIKTILTQDINVQIRTLNKICKGLGVTLREFFNHPMFDHTWE